MVNRLRILLIAAGFFIASQLSAESGPLPGQVFFLSFLEGNPGIPGDGIFISPAGGNPFFFELLTPFPLNGITDGITVSAFFPLTPPVPNVPDFGIVIVNLYAPAECLVVTRPGGSEG